jgi:hypothetical protein
MVVPFVFVSFLRLGSRGKYSNGTRANSLAQTPSYPVRDRMDNVLVDLVSGLVGNVCGFGKNALAWKSAGLLR